MSATDHDYPVETVKRVDGDTADFDVDLGFGLTFRIRVRILGLRAREDRAGAIESGIFTGWLADNAGHLHVLTHKPRSASPVPDASFGRWLGEVYAAHTGERFADYLIAVMRDTYGIDVTARP